VDERPSRAGSLIAAALVLGTVAILFVVLTSSGDSPRTVSRAKAQAIAREAESVGCKLQSFPNYGREHTKKKVPYKTNPPTSGPHNPAPADDGEYDTAPRPENWVHSLEHGRVILQYRLGSTHVAALEAIFGEDEHHMLLMPNNTGMPYEVAAIAWRNSLVCKTYDARAAPVLRAFRDAYRDTAPERVP
jgi:hypothetical protein